MMRKFILLVSVIFSVYSSNTIAELTDENKIIEANRFIESTTQQDEAIKKKFSSSLNKESRLSIVKDAEKKQTEFDMMDISQKHYILKEIRQIDSGNSVDAAIAAKSMDLAENDGFFILDLSDEQLDYYYKKAKDEITAINGGQSEIKTRAATTCFTGSFPNFTPKKDSGGGAVHYRPTGVTPVKNGTNDCDWKVWFSSSKPYVWSTTFLGRTLLNAFGSGVGSQKSSSGDKLLLGATRTSVILGGTSAIMNAIVIW